MSKTQLYKKYKFQVGNLVSDGCRTGLVLGRYSSAETGSNYYTVHYFLPEEYVPYYGIWEGNLVLIQE